MLMDIIKERHSIRKYTDKQILTVHTWQAVLCQRNSQKVNQENQEELKLQNRWRTDGFSNMLEKNGIGGSACVCNSGQLRSTTDTQYQCDSL